MLKSINWKRVLSLCCWILCLAGLVVLMSFISEKKHTMKCTEVKILIPGTSSFIDRKEINRIVLESAGKLHGRLVDGINFHQIETVLKQNPYIRAAKVYCDMDGVVHLEIDQRDPVLRVYNKHNQDYYVDRDGMKIPTSPTYTPHVLVANGLIDESYSGRVDTLRSALAKDLFKVALFVEKDSLWSEQVEQVFVDGKKEIQLIPRVGNQIILLGDADSLAVRMNNLRLFYQKALPKVGWEKYKTINIKYTNQIVCEKNSAADSSRMVHPATPFRPVDSSQNIQSTAKKQ